MIRLVRRKSAIEVPAGRQELQRRLLRRRRSASPAVWLRPMLLSPGAVLVGGDPADRRDELPRRGCPTGARPRCTRTPCRPRPAPAPPPRTPPARSQRHDPPVVRLIRPLYTRGVRGSCAPVRRLFQRRERPAPPAKRRGALDAPSASTSRPSRASSASPSASGSPSPRAAPGGRRASCPAGSRRAARPARARAPRARPRHDLGHEPDRERLGGLDRAAREDQVERAALADDPRQPLRAAVDQRHAPAALGAAEASRPRSPPQVAPERELEPAGQAPARRRRRSSAWARRAG